MDQKIKIKKPAIAGLETKRGTQLNGATISPSFLLTAKPVISKW